MTISNNVVKTDARLEREANASRIELAKHRWHWTLDESNPRRVSIGEYARQVARGKTTIYDMVTGYADWVVRGAPNDEFADYMARAKLRGNTLHATEAVAKANKVSVDTARRHHAEEVRKVKDDAADRAERKGTTVREEIQPVAEFRAQVRQSRAKTREQDKKSHSFRFVQADGEISAATRSLRKALEETDGVEFTEEETEMLTYSVERLKTLVNLLDVRITGTTDVDWDTEMAKLTAGEQS